MKEIKISGFTDDTTPDDKPAVAIFGEENVGKTRFAITMPEPIGYLALDKNAKRTINMLKDELGRYVVVSQKPFITDKEAMSVARLDAALDSERKKITELYSDVVDRVRESAMALVENKDIQSIVVDTASQLNDWIVFSHFGRKNQIKPTSRGAANQDMIDFINMLSSKNVCLIHRNAEVWKATGAKDKDGNDIQAPSGKFRPDGFNKIGGFVTATVELTAKRNAKDLEDKYRVKVVTCKGQTLLESQDLKEYGMSGADITWDNLLTVLGVTE
jgi:hypothetical protein